MPHLVILYTPNLDSHVDMKALCGALAETMRSVQDDAGQPVFPTGGIRVLAYAATHHAVADGQGDYGFAYLNLRMARGRSPATQRRAGEALAATARRFFDAALAARPVGVTLQIDEGAEVFDFKHSSLHPLFARPG